MAKRTTKLFFCPEGTKGQDVVSLTGKETRFNAREVPWRLYKIGSVRGAFDLSGNRIFAVSHRSGYSAWDTYAYAKGIRQEMEAHKTFQMQNTSAARAQPKVGGQFDPFFLSEAHIYVNWHVYERQENPLASYAYKRFFPDWATKLGLNLGLPTINMLASTTRPLVFSITGRKQSDSIARIACSPTVSMDQVLTFIRTVGNMNLFNKQSPKDALKEIGNEVLGTIASHA